MSNPGYSGRVRLYRVEDGEAWYYAATSANEARSLHEMAMGPDPDTPADEWEVTELPPDQMHTVGGDVDEREVPPGGQWIDNQIVATSAQFAAQHEARGGCNHSLFGSVY